MDNKPPPRNLLPKAELGSASESPTLASIPFGGEQPTKRRCVSSACMPCRKRKSKCDGAQPSCNSCTSVYSSQCYYDIDSDHRRKGALKRDIAQLREELDAQSVILNAIKKGSETDADDIVQLVRANPDESYDSIAESIERMSISKQKSETSSGGIEAELVDLVKPSMDKTGDVGHYGHISNLVIGLDAEQDSIEGDLIGSWTNVTNDAELINHLLDLYFTWTHPFYLIFSEEVFYHGFRDRKLKYCTPLLVNAILAVGCHFSDRPEARADEEDPLSIGRHFFAEAKRILQADERVCLTTIQALSLMSMQQGMSSQDSNGWQYASLMMSMSVQLGLHLSAPPNGKMTPYEIEARRVTFWGAFINQTAWAIGVGRISALPRAAIRLEKPCLLPHLENRLWKPHGLPGYDGTSSDLEQPSFKYTILLHTSLLSELVDDVIHMFYAPKDRITSRKLQQHHEILQAWFKNLPEGLQIKKGEHALPQVLTLHMYYHNCVLLLFRPFLKVSFVQNVKPPRQICTEAADEISSLTSVLSQTYGMRRSFFMATHCIMSAAIIHVVNISSTTPAINPIKEQQEIFLADAIRNLHQMQQPFPIVGRFLKAITSLIYKWCQVIPPRVWEAMTDVEIGSPSSASTDSSTHNQPHMTWAQFSSIHVSSSNPNITNNNISGFQLPSSTSEQPNHSAPELIAMAPQVPGASHIDLNTGQPHAYQQQFFWTPFPDALDGVPLAVTGNEGTGGPGQGMNITNMLDGEYPLLNQDGFMVGSEGEGWDFNWDGVRGFS